MIAAILRAQLLSMRLTAGARRGGSIFSIVTALVFYGFWTAIAGVAAVFFEDPERVSSFTPALASALLAVMTYWQFAPVVSASLGASLDLRKLLAYPIPHRALFTVEALLRITACGEMPIVVTGITIGLLRNPSTGGANSPFVVGGALLFMATNILISAGTRNLMERIFLRTRMKEVTLLIFALAGLAPQFLRFMHVKASTLLLLVPSGTIWPWAAGARLMLRESAALSAASAIAYLAIAWSFGRWQFERTLRADASGVGPSARTAWGDNFAEGLVRIPARFLPDPLAALVEKELRTLARIARFRLVYAMSCLFGVVLYLPWLRRSGQDSFVLTNAMPAMALYGLLMLGQISYWNSFGFDRSAAQGYFSWPIRMRDVLVAKNLAVVLLIPPQILAVALSARALHLVSSPDKILEAGAVSLIAALYWCAVGNLVSVRMPRPLDPDKMNQASNKLQALSMFSAPFLLLPIGLAYAARAVFESQWIFIGGLMVAAGLGVVFYLVALDSAVASAARGREEILGQLSKSGGPLSIA